ncbi:MAG: hypothetical protein J0M00_20165, partial [Burkholderiales bacterium]|nr:hypothetical protein [Burkholderiales bacterium]
EPRTRINRASCPVAAPHHRDHDHALQPVLACATCGEPVDARSAEVQPTRAALREREAFASAVRRR